MTTKKASTKKAKEDGIIDAALKSGLAESEFLTQCLLAAKIMLVLVQEENYGSTRRLAYLLGGENPTAMIRWFKGATPSRENLLRLGALVGIPDEVGGWVNKLRFGTKIETRSWEPQFDALVASEQAQRLRENLRQRISEINVDDWYRTVPLILDQLTLPDEQLIRVNAAVMSCKKTAADFKPKISDLLQVS